MEVFAGYNFILCDQGYDNLYNSALFTGKRFWGVLKNSIINSSISIETDSGGNIE